MINGSVLLSHQNPKQNHGMFSHVSGSFIAHAVPSAWNVLHTPPFPTHPHNPSKSGVNRMGSNPSSRASLVVRWLRIRLPMQGTWVQALVQEDPTCRGATKPVRHNY